MKRQTNCAVYGPIIPAGVLTDRQAVAFDGTWRGPTMRIADRNFNGVAFLFRSRQEAEKRVRGGGSAFLVGRRITGSEEWAGGTGAYLPYLVSNKHVVFGVSACVASINRKDGGAPDIWDIDQNDWIPHPGGDDLVATCVAGRLDRAIHSASFIQEDWFISPEFVADYNIGMGDEVFMIGRFYNLQGRKINQPALRQGGISMMLQPIWESESKRFQESFGVEMRSKEGFSGSPVIVWRKPWTVADDTPEEKCNFTKLLGVNWGYILDEHGENTQLNGVVPAWKIGETLNTPALREIHAMIEADLARDVLRNPGAARSAYIEEVPAAEAEATNPHHKEDFRALLGVAAKAKL